MTPFPGEFDFESQAFGFHYALQIEGVQDTFIASAYIRLPLGHPLYKSEHLHYIQAQDLPDMQITGASFGMVGNNREDRSAWWVGVGYEVESFGGAVETVERLLQYMTGEETCTYDTAGATIGGPAWEIL